MCGFGGDGREGESEEREVATTAASGDGVLAVRRQRGRLARGSFAASSSWREGELALCSDAPIERSLACSILRAQALLVERLGAR